MSNIFKVKDPRGWEVTCSEECWYGHILKRRPWMDGWEVEVSETIINPDTFIYQDASNSQKHIYYCHRAGKNRYMKVIVLFRQEGHGEVLSAYPADSGKSGEKLIWTKN